MHPTDLDSSLMDPPEMIAAMRSKMTVSSSGTGRVNPALSRQGSGTTSPKSSSGFGPTSVKVAPKPVTQSARVREKLKKSIEEKQGACFRTEIRDSGNFICGVHQSELWSEDLKECPTLKSILDLACAAVEEVVKEDAFEEELRREETQRKTEEAQRKIDEAARKAGRVIPSDEQQKRDAARKIAEGLAYRKARERGMAGSSWIDSRRGTGR